MRCDEPLQAFVSDVRIPGMTDLHDIHIPVEPVQPDDVDHETPK
jgi:hypothetical protein